jgi:CheY-like chemotaxis protein
MGGEISLDSGKDKGSRFHFSIELPEVEATPADSIPDFGDADILVASSSPVVGPLLARRLTAWSAQASLAQDVQVAEALLPERRWTHFLVDLGLGIDATTKLGALAMKHTQFRHVLVAPAERGMLDELRAAGFESYLVKPVRAASLAARIARPESAPPLVPEPEDQAEHDRAAGRRALAVLVVEDNDINALLIQAMLGKLGHVPTVVADGISAVSAVTTAHAVGAPYDVVLMDLHLPGMDGLEAARRIRVLGSDGGNVPIIALTANAFAEDRQAAREAGMDAFVMKPVDRDRLEETMAAVRAARGAAPLAEAAEVPPLVKPAIG